MPKESETPANTTTLVGSSKSISTTPSTPAATQPTNPSSSGGETITVETTEGHQARLVIFWSRGEAVPARCLEMQNVPVGAVVESVKATIDVEYLTTNGVPWPQEKGIHPLFVKPKTSPAILTKLANYDVCDAMPLGDGTISVNWLPFDDHAKTRLSPEHGRRVESYLYNWVAPTPKNPSPNARPDMSDYDLVLMGLNVNTFYENVTTTQIDISCVKPGADWRSDKWWHGSVCRLFDLPK